jgi:hypothetical protein
MIGTNVAMSMYTSMSFLIVASLVELLSKTDRFAESGSWKLTTVLAILQGIALVFA